jgi:hypothetical protein
MSHGNERDNGHPKNEQRIAFAHEARQAMASEDAALVSVATTLAGTLVWRVFVQSRTVDPRANPDSGANAGTPSRLGHLAVNGDRATPGA